ncbi:MAG: glycosyltransferase [Candidatus Krumholzibacteriales bacterium]
MESRKIFILASTLVIGGAEMVVSSLAENLRAGGFDIELIFIREPGEIGERLIDSGIKHQAGLAESRFDPRTLPRLTGTLRNHRDSALLVLDHHNAILWGALASRLARIRGSVLSVHSTGLWGSGRTFNLADRMVLNLFDRVIALSETHAEYLSGQEGVPSGKLTVINNGIDTGRFNPAGRDEKGKKVREELGIESEDTVVSIVAALRPEKNHLMFLEAAGSVLKRSREFRFLIVGEGEQRQELERKTGRMDIADRVIFTGSRDDIPDILAATDISVLCSHPVVETFPLTVLEAMACGLPVISTDVGSVSEIITDRENGILIPSGDTEALTDAMMELASDRNLRERLGGNARRKVAGSFSDEKMAEKYIAVFDDIFNK